MRHNNVKIGLANQYKLQLIKVDADGNLIESTRRDATDWFENLITDHGMNAFGNPSLDGVFARGCRIGAGTTAPVFGDTNLVSILATSETLVGTMVISRNIAVAPYYVEKTITYRFAAGVGTGNVAELGLVAGPTGVGSGGIMNPATAVTTRALVTPVVTKLADEVLDVVAKIRLYFSTTDVTAVVNLDDDVDVTDYTYTLRPSEIDRNADSSGGVLHGWGNQTTGWSFGIAVGSFSSIRMDAFVGNTSAIGLATESPTGVDSISAVPTFYGSVASAAYVPGSYYRDHTISFTLGVAGAGINNPDGIGAMLFGLTDCAYQIGFSPRIAKTVDKEVAITIRVSWERFVP